MIDARAFRGFRFPAEAILWAVRWYPRFPLGYRELERMLADRGVAVDHTTMYRWVRRFAPELERRMRRHLRPCRGPWHVDETYLRVDGRWRYLYRAVDGTGQTIEFRLTAKRDKQAAKRFFRKALGRENTRHPRTIVTDRLGSYPGALRGMRQKGELGRFTRHRRGRWLNNRVERDHRRIKRRTRPMLGFQSFRTARRTLAGVEAMAMLAKGQVRAVPADLVADTLPGREDAYFNPYRIAPPTDAAHPHVLALARRLGTRAVYIGRQWAIAHGGWVYPTCGRGRRSVVLPADRLRSAQPDCPELDRGRRAGRPGAISYGGRVIPNPRSPDR